jgi:hypothetical protein
LVQVPTKVTSSSGPAAKGKGTPMTAMAIARARESHD